MNLRDGRERKGLSARLALVLAAFVAATDGCSLWPGIPQSAEPPGPLAVESVFPLTVRSHWTYRVQDFAKHWTYQDTVRVHGPRVMEALGREGILVEERYSSASGPYFVEELEPMIYYKDAGFLHRIHLTQQGGKLVPASGSADSRFLPELVEVGSSWESSTVAFRVTSELGFTVVHRHVVARERGAVRVPAGSFSNCIRIDTYSTHGPGSGAKPGEEIAFFYSDWYAPGVGLVRTQQWDDGEHEHERTRIELVGYEIAPAARGSE